MSVILDREDFIRANTRLLAVPHAPQIKLYLADDVTEIWQKTEDDLAKIGLPPPFWAFAWAGGQALARYVLDNPAITRGKRVLDVGSGSGLVAIAAAMTGALRVEANDVDEFALSAIAFNARVNQVAVTARAGDIAGSDEGWDVVLAGDVSYERDMAARISDWLASLAARGAVVLIGDPNRTYLARERLESIADYSVPVAASLEDVDIKRTGVWRFRKT